MDEIEKRLRETSENCFKSYEAWRKEQKNGPVRESLQDAIHELRKVASRLEIELAVSERNEMAQKPIPIPPHRDAKHRSGNDAEFEGQRFESDNDGGPNYNTPQGHSQQRSGGTMKRRVQRRGEGAGPGNN
ncbi:MAG: hypothetical protein KA155_04800 [Alphaproteobacteria bacterium]|jgi:hypothetical protein|nr:hypothetical protein [Alphaproteobacteria bacterium]